MLLMDTTVPWSNPLPLTVSVVSGTPVCKNEGFRDVMLTGPRMEKFNGLDSNPESPKLTGTMAGAVTRLAGTVTVKELPFTERAASAVPLKFRNGVAPRMGVDVVAVSVKEDAPAVTKVGAREVST